MVGLSQVKERDEPLCDQFCDLNHVRHAELPQIMFKLNSSNSNDSKPLSCVLIQSPDEITQMALIHGLERLLRYAIKVGFTNLKWGLQKTCHRSMEDPNDV